MSKFLLKIIRYILACALTAFLLIWIYDLVVGGPISDAILQFFYDLGDLLESKAEVLFFQTGLL